jgi:hypothetical protein
MPPLHNYTAASEPHKQTPLMFQFRRGAPSGHERLPDARAAADGVDSRQRHAWLDTRLLRLLLPARHHAHVRPLRVPHGDTPPRGAVLGALCMCASPPTAPQVSTSPTARPVPSRPGPISLHDAIRLAAVSALPSIWTPRSRLLCSRSYSTHCSHSARSRST